ncbi:MAG: HAMP domain-containing histidine kinase [Alistipes sp.]|nr:HAMP domain-containing histidine kinase [Alistipes sp.]
MRLIYRIVVRLGIALLIIMSLWATLFYYTMVDEIRDEADDSLEDYSELIITRVLAGRALPQVGDGSNNSFTLTPVDASYVAERPHLKYEDHDFYIAEKQETEPARVLTTIFHDQQGQYYELRVATPTFEKVDLFQSILWWVVALYIVLLLITLGVTMLIFYGNMRPMYAILRWLDDYKPGVKPSPVPITADVKEFARLGRALQGAVDRSEELVERQSQFIGNASHELQTPLAIIGNRVEWLLDEGNLTDEQGAELFKIQSTLARAVRLNKTLLLLTKIENGKFPDSVQVDVARLVQDSVEMYGEIYASRQMTVQVDIEDDVKVEMNESLAATLVSNLIKNMYVHSAEGAEGRVVVGNNQLVVENDGEQTLDRDRIFDRFYQGSKSKGSMGLGLPLVAAVCRTYSLGVKYQFKAGRHCFIVDFS